MNGSSGAKIMHDTIKSMSKARGYSSSSSTGGPRQVADLQQVVRRLQRESASNAELAAQSQSALEALRSDNSALRKAVKTMSNVFMEEVDSQHEEINAKFEQMHKKMEDQQSVIDDLREQLDLARKESQGYKEEAGRKFKTVDALVEDVKALNGDISAMANIRANLDDIDSRARQQLQRMEAVTAAHANMNEWVQQMRAEVAALQAAMLTFKEDYGVSTSALAQDVAALADDAGS